MQDTDPKSENDESAAEGPSLWRDRFHALSPAEAPCPGFRGRAWGAVFDATVAFLDLHAGAAQRLGWTTMELFGVHRRVGAVRVDCCGALMVCGGARVQDVERDVIRLGNRRFFRTPISVETVPVWSFEARP